MVAKSLQSITTEPTFIGASWSDGEPGQTASWARPRAGPDGELGQGDDAVRMGGRARLRTVAAGLALMLGGTEDSGSCRTSPHGRLPPRTSDAIVLESVLTAGRAAAMAPPGDELPAWRRLRLVVLGLALAALVVKVVV